MNPPKSGRKRPCATPPDSAVSLVSRPSQLRRSSGNRMAPPVRAVSTTDRTVADRKVRCVVALGEAPARVVDQAGVDIDAGHLFCADAVA